MSDNEYCMGHAACKLVEDIISQGFHGSLMARMPEELQKCLRCDKIKYTEKEKR